MKYVLRKPVDMPRLISRNNIVVQADRGFIELCGFPQRDVIGKSIADIAVLLRIDSQLCLETMEGETQVCLFTRTLEPREVRITSRSNAEERVYRFREIPNSRIENMLPYCENILRKNEVGFAVIKLPVSILMKANQMLLDTLEGPYMSLENSIGKDIRKMIPDNYLEIVSESRMTERLKDGLLSTAVHSETGYFKKGGRYFDILSFPVFLSPGARYAMIAVIDITEKIIAKRLVEEQKNELETIIENISDELVICDRYGNFTKINKAFRNNPLFQTEGFLTPDMVFDMVQHLDKDGRIIPFQDLPSMRLMRGEPVNRFRMDIRRGEKTVYREVDGTPIYDKEGNFAAGVLISRDIGSRLKNEENLLVKTQYDMLSRIIENLELSFIRCSYPDFRILDFNNKAYTDMLQIDPRLKTPVDIIGHYFYDVVMLFRKDELIESITKVFEKKGSIYSFIKKFHIAETDKYFKIVWQPLFGLEKQIIEVIIMMIDITDEIMAKNKMEEALRIQDEIFANVSHELKTPLNVIFSTTQLLEHYLGKPSGDFSPKVMKSIQTIKQNCYRFIKLINNIVDLSKLDSGFLRLNLENVNIVEIVENIVQSVSEYVKAKGLSILFDTDTEEKVIACDPEKIERIILNLVSNAIKFSNPGGTIYVDVSDKAERVEISVRDTGIGIEKKYLDFIFKRFHQVDKTLARNAEGSGIGLSLVKSIVDMHGGRIGVSSEVGKGSVFRFELPAVRVECPKEDAGKIQVGRNVEMINIEFSDIYHL